MALAARYFVGAVLAMALLVLWLELIQPGAPTAGSQLAMDETLAARWADEPRPRGPPGGAAAGGLAEERLQAALRRADAAAVHRVPPPPEAHDEPECNKPRTVFAALSGVDSGRFPDRVWMSPMNQGCEAWCREVRYEKGRRLSELRRDDLVGITERLVAASDVTLAHFCWFARRFTPMPWGELYNTTQRLGKLLAGGCHEDLWWGTNLIYRPGPDFRLDISASHLQTSNLWFPYQQAGFEEMYAAPYPRTPAEIHQMRPKLAVYMSSNRKSAGWNRLEYATAFTNLLPTDCPGTVLNNMPKIPKGFSAVDIFRRYRFVLALENALSPDYVSEKFYNVLVAGSVPVYRGSQTIETMAPKGSYIDTRDFEDVEALVAHLRFLEANPLEYLKYFAWKAEPFRAPPAFDRTMVKVQNMSCGVCRYVRECKHGCPPPPDAQALRCGDPKRQHQGL